MTSPVPSWPAATPRRFSWRRQLQFRLRTLLVFTTIIAVWLGWWSYKARQQRESVAALKKIGALIFYDTHLPCTGWMADPPKSPEWLLDSVNLDYFASVIQIGFYDCTVTDKDLEHIRNLTALRSLDLCHKSVTDTGLEHLKNLRALEVLWLDDTQITDAGLEHLKGLPALRALRIEKTHVTDAGVTRLKQSLPRCVVVLNDMPDPRRKSPTAASYGLNSSSQ